MPLLRFAPIFALFFTFAAYAADDPFCKNHQGVRKLNPFGESALHQIKPCALIYCNPEVFDQTIKDNIKVIDETLGNVQLASFEYGNAVGKYEKVCKAYMKNPVATGPRLDEVRNTFFLLQSKADKADEMVKLVDSTDRFNATAAQILRDYKDQNCFQAINQTTKLRLDETSQITARLSKIRCSQ